MVEMKERRPDGGVVAVVRGHNSASVIMKDIRCLAELEVCH